MDNHQLMLKISRLLPSSLTSCHFRNVAADVADSSIKPDLENDRTSFLSLHKHSTKSPLRNRFINHSSTSNGGCSFTTSDDRDTDTFFSLSSDSFRRGSFTRRDDHIMKTIDETAKCSRRPTAPEKKKKKMKSSCRVCPEQEPGSDQISTQLYYSGGRNRRRRRRTKKSGGGAVIGDSYAVEKRSSDPHGDFRASMVEMIIEKRIFAAPDLERLLRCFLSLNSPSYHGIIFHVFTEICQTLFTN